MITGGYGSIPKVPLQTRALRPSAAITFRLSSMEGVLSDAAIGRRFSSEFVRGMALLVWAASSFDDNGRAAPGSLVGAS